MSKRLVYGVGINDVDYVTQIFETVSRIDGRQKQKRVWICPFYKTWKSMLERSYSAKLKAKYPTYMESLTTTEWHRLSAFKDWMEKQDWNGKQLDKDLLLSGNKLYSPETCVFVSSQVNSFLTDHGAGRGQYMIGVCWDKCASKFRSQCRNPFTKESEYLGLFYSELEAHKAWLKRKLEHAYNLASIQTDERIANALINRYNNFTQ